MNGVYSLVQGDLPYPLLAQGQRPKTKLLEEFLSLKGSVLFATASFWEGVDVRGEALSCVIVDRLPFAPPDDPIIEARSEYIRKQGGSPFLLLHVPMAIISLRQGLGRLIRTRSDRGLLAILDTRIITKSYGKLFLKSLHTGPLTRNKSDLERFFGSESVNSAAN
jgi:ATP-dependent DNA helicase DinG